MYFRQLRRLRHECGYSQDDLAALVGVSRPMIAQIETGVRVPSLPLAVAIATVIGCTLDELVFDRSA